MTSEGYEALKRAEKYARMDGANQTLNAAERAQAEASIAIAYELGKIARAVEFASHNLHKTPRS